MLIDTTGPSSSDITSHYPLLLNKRLRLALTGILGARADAAVMDCTDRFGRRAGVPAALPEHLESTSAPGADRPGGGRHPRLFTERRLRYSAKMYAPTCTAVPWRRQLATCPVPSRMSGPSLAAAASPAVWRR